MFALPSSSYFARVPLLLLLCAVAGCAMQSYRAAPIDPAASAQRFEQRTLDAPELKTYMQSHMRSDLPWPIERWGLPELTLLALYGHPDLDVARAQAKALRAEGLAATQRLPVAIAPRLEHHSLRTPEQSSPWSLGFEVQIPLSLAATGNAIHSHYDALAHAADLKVAAAAWEIRSRLRARLIDVYANGLEMELAHTEKREREAMLSLLDRRLQAGFASAIEVNNARLALVDVQSRLQMLNATRARTLAGLAEAIGVPLALVQSMQLDFAQLNDAAPAPSDVQRQRAVLLNRLDVRGKLLEYAAAEADVRLEVARQYPTVSLTPGFLWDQGDNIWSLAATLVPAMLGNRPAIAAAQARRDLEASRFRALQEQVIVQAQGAQAAYASQLQALEQGEQSRALQIAHEQQIVRQFEAGQADRVELTAARLEAIAAQRATIALRIEALRSQGALEDALQIPLAGDPLPLAGVSFDSLTGLTHQ